MRIIVTGGAGFIGSVLVRYLINIGNHEVLNIDCLTYAGNPNSLKDIEENNRYKFTQTNINDRDAIQHLFADYEPDAVIHTAAESHVDRSINGPSEFINTNIIGTFNLLDVSKEYWGNLPNVKKNNFRFLHMSTDEVFGDLDLDDDPFVETTPYEPSSPYSASKASSDHLVRAWFRTYGLPTIITNCSNNYGPFQFPEKLVPLIITNIMQGKSLPIYGSGKQIRDWLYVEDHARAIELVLKKGKIGNSYNIGGCNEIQNIEVVKMICNHFEELAPAKPKGINKYQDLIVHIDDRPGHDKRYAMNIDKIASELNWAPEESFETGIRKTIEWYLDNKNWWKMILDGSYKMIDSKGVIKS